MSPVEKPCTRTFSPRASFDSNPVALFQKNGNRQVYGFEKGGRIRRPHPSFFPPFVLLLLIIGLPSASSAFDLTVSTPVQADLSQIRTGKYLHHAGTTERTKIQYQYLFVHNIFFTYIECLGNISSSLQQQQLHLFSRY